MSRQMTLVDKLRLYALRMRLQELIIESKLKPFRPEPMTIKPVEIFPVKEVYDLGFHESEPSKFIGNPKRNYKR